MKIRLALTATVLSFLTLASSGANAQDRMMRTDRGMAMSQTQPMHRMTRTKRHTMSMRSNKGGMMRGQARASQVQRMNRMKRMDRMNDMR